MLPPVFTGFNSSALFENNEGEGDGVDPGPTFNGFTGRAFARDPDGGPLPLTITLTNVRNGNGRATDNNGGFFVTPTFQGPVLLTFTADDGFFMVDGVFDISTSQFQRRPGEPDEGEPIIIDLNENGLELRPFNVFNATQFDIDGDGVAENLSFATNGDGVLAVDINEDGIIENRNEIAFIDYVEGAETDLEGLRFFDTNEDGILDAEDEQFDLFGAVVDNGDGIIEESEFISLADLDVESINLTSDGIEQSLGDSGTLLGTTSATRSDGSTITVGDASLTFSNERPDLLLDNDTINRPGDERATVDEFLTENIVEVGLLDESLPNLDNTSDTNLDNTSDTNLDNTADTNQPEMATDLSVLLAPTDTPMPTDDDVNQVVALANQEANSQPHDEDLSAQENLPVEESTAANDEEPVLAVI